MNLCLALGLAEVFGIQVGPIADLLQFMSFQRPFSTFPERNRVHTATHFPVNTVRP
jgi:hypothetical protein